MKSRTNFILATKSEKEGDDGRRRNVGGERKDKSEQNHDTNNALELNEYKTGRQVVQPLML